MRAAASEQDGAIYLTAAFTGLRMGELLALRWRDVDFELQAIRVRAGYTHRQLDTPKNRTRRTVPMIEPVEQAWLAGGNGQARSPATSRAVALHPEPWA